MAHDIITEDEFDRYEERRPAKRSGGSPPPPKGNGLKDYLIVALIAIIAVMGINNYIFARGNNSFGIGGCCGGGRGGAATGPTTEELREIGLDYYAANYGDDEVEAVVKDFGCHQEIHIFKEGELVIRVGYGNGQVYEL